MRTSDYSDFLVRMGGFIGVDSGNFTTQELTRLNGFFQKNIRKIWETTFWPEVCLLESRTPNASYAISYEQAGQTEIDVVLDVYSATPTTSSAPRRLGWILTSEGIQLTTATSTAAVWVWFRKRVPRYTGATLSTSSAYAVGDRVYYTTTAGAGNYYVCAATATAGQTPDTHASKWTIQSIPYNFFEYAIQASFADWLRSDGQRSAASQEQAMSAQSVFDDALDKFERQQRTIAPTIFLTHLNSRPAY